MNQIAKNFYEELDRAVKEIGKVCTRYNSACPIEVTWALDAKGYVTFQNLMGAVPKESYLHSNTFPETGKIHIGDVTLNFSGKREHLK